MVVEFTILKAESVGSKVSEDLESVVLGIFIPHIPSKL